MTAKRPKRFFVRAPRRFLRSFYEVCAPDGSVEVQYLHENKAIQMRNILNRGFSEGYKAGLAIAQPKGV